MRILYVAPDVPVPHAGRFLGGSTHVLKISESLAKRGHEVLIISRRMKGQAKFEKIADKIVTRRFYRGLFLSLEGKPKQKSKALLNKLIKIVESLYFTVYRLVLTIYVLWLMSKRSFDLVIERNSAKGIGAFPAKIFRVKCVVEVIDPDFNIFQLRFADKILAYTRDIIPEDCQTKVTLTHAGVDIELFRPFNSDDIREKFGLRGKRVVVYVGETSEWHGADLLVRIAEKISSNVVFLMVGKNLELLRREVEKKSLSRKFIFVGFVKHEDVPRFISVADVTIAPYRKTKKMRKFYFSPIKIFEYMACGKAIIASDLEMIRDIISANRCGLLAKPGNVEDFASKIEVLLKDKRMRKRMEKNGRKAALKYTWDRVADAILSDYHG